MNRVLKNSVLGILVVFIIGFTSCFEIEEVITINADGSGSRLILIDMTQYVNLIMEFGGEDFTSDDIEMLFENDSVYQSLQKIPGIRNIKNLNDVFAKIFGQSYDFDNIEALNASMEVTSFMNTLVEEEGSSEAFFLGKNFFERKYSPAPVAEESDDLDMVSIFMSEFKYRVKYILPKEIKNASIEGILISDDKKAVEYTYTFEEISSGTGTGIKIIF